MEELLTLKELLHQGKVDEALLIVEELEEMSKSDKLNKIFSYAIILLMHLIKQEAEKRLARSWQLSIRNSVKQIQRTNKRHQAKGNYLTEAELEETIVDAYELALGKAALEAFEGRYETEEIAEMVEQQQIIALAMDLILEREQEEPF
jgi:regulator of RNase E activity RraB